MREFKKIENFENITKEQYDKLELPERSTQNSAGYDFHTPYKVILKAGESTKIATYIKAQMENDDVLMIFPRSSLGFKHNVRLANTVGIVDSDYYNNPDNEGHIYIKLYNPNDYDIILEEGERFAQGIFIKFGRTDNDATNEIRNGGIGSTGK